MKQQKILSIFSALILLLPPLVNASGVNNLDSLLDRLNDKSNINSNNDSKSNDSANDLYREIDSEITVHEYKKAIEIINNNFNDIDVNKKIWGDWSLFYNTLQEAPSLEYFPSSCLRQYADLLKILINKNADLIYYYKNGDYESNALVQFIENAYDDQLTDLMNERRPYIDEPFIEVIELLFSKNLNLDKNQEIILKIAKNNCEHLAEVLFKHNAINVNYRDEYGGITPLMVACENGSYEMARFLLSNGADPNLKDEKGETALKKLDNYHYSKDDKFYNVLFRKVNPSKIKKLLKQYGANDCVIC